MTSFNLRGMKKCLTLMELVPSDWFSTRMEAGLQGVECSALGLLIVFRLLDDGGQLIGEHPRDGCRSLRGDDAQFRQQGLVNRQGDILFRYDEQSRAARD